MKLSGGVVLTTCCESTADVLPRTYAEPAYCAVMLCVPLIANDAASVATPLTFSVPAPIVVAPSKNVTLPAGTTPGELTVAVSVTGWPVFEGLGEEMRVVAVCAGTGLTDSGKLLDVLVRKFPSPPYRAVMV